MVGHALAGQQNDVRSQHNVLRSLSRTNERLQAFFLAFIRVQRLGNFEHARSYRAPKPLSSNICYTTLAALHRRRFAHLSSWLWRVLFLGLFQRRRDAFSILKDLACGQSHQSWVCLGLLLALFEKLLLILNDLLALLLCIFNISEKAAQIRAADFGFWVSGLPLK